MANGVTNDIDEAFTWLEADPEGAHKFRLECEHNVWSCMVDGMHFSDGHISAVDAMVAALLEREASKRRYK